MEQNYKRLAVATMAALFVGNVVPETVGMDLSPDMAELMRTATLCTGQEIRFNRQDQRSIFDAFKQAIAVSDFPTAIAVGSFRSRNNGLQSFSNEVDNIIIAAMKKNPRAGILKSQLSDDGKLLWMLDSVNEDNYVQQYEECEKLIGFMRASYYSSFDPAFLPKNILIRVNPETEAGKSLKEDLLREFSLYE